MKMEIGSLINEGATLAGLDEVLAERFAYYNERRRHSGICYETPLRQLKSTFINDEPG